MAPQTPKNMKMPPALVRRANSFSRMSAMSTIARPSHWKPAFGPYTSNNMVIPPLRIGAFLAAKPAAGGAQEASLTHSHRLRRASNRCCAVPYL